MQKQGLGRYRSQNSSETSQNLIANTEKYLGEKLNKMKDSAPKKNDVKGGDASQRLPKKHVCQKSHNSSEQSDKILVNHRSVKAKFCNLQRDNKKFFWNSNQKGRRSQASSSQPTKDLSCKAPTVPVIKDVQVEKTKVTPIHDQRKVIFLEENLFKKTPEKLETETAEPISVSQLETETTHSDMPSLPLSEATSHNVSVNANFVIESSEEILNNNPSSGKQVEDFTEVLENRAPTEKLPSPPLSEAASQNVSVNANFVFESFEGINNNAFPSDRQVEDVIQVLGNQASTENVCIEEKIELQAIGQTSNATGDIELCTERAVFATTYVASNSNRYKSIEMDLFKDKNDNHVLKTPPKAVKKPDSFIRTSSGKSSIYCQLSPKVCSFAPKPVKERVPNQKLSISAMIDEMKKKNATEKINSYMMFLPEAFSDGTLTESTVKNLYGNFDVEVVKSHYNLNGERLGSGTISVPGNCHERIQNWAPDRKWRAIRMGLLKQRETSGTKVKLYLKLSGEWTPIKIVRFQTCLQDSYHVSDFTLIYDFNGLFAKAVTVFMAYENAQQLQKSFELSETMEPNLRVKILEILESSNKIHVQHKKF